MPYLVSVPDPYDRISKHHRWGPFRLTPDEISNLTGRRASATSCRAGRLRARDRGDDQGTNGARRIAAQDFRRALGLRSTWFAVRVLDLDPPIRSALATDELKLTGFVRGLRRCGSSSR